MPSYNIHEFADKYGIKETTVIADGATYKNAGSPMQPVSERDQAYFQALIDHAFYRFKEVVKTGRKLKTNIDEVAVGKIFSSKEALDLGLIDQIDYSEAAWDKAAQLAGLKNKEVVKYTPSQGIFDMLSTDTKFTHTAPQSSVTINGINFNVDRNALSDLLTPRPMYLWRGQ
jgi:protease-4